MAPLKRSYTIVETLQSTSSHTQKEGKFSLIEVTGGQFKLIRKSDHFNELETIMFDLSQPQTAEEHRYELQRMRDIMCEIRDDLSPILNQTYPTFAYGEVGRLRAIHKTLNDKIKETEWVYDNPSPVLPETIDEEAELWQK